MYLNTPIHILAHGGAIYVVFGIPVAAFIGIILLVAGIKISQKDRPETISEDEFRARQSDLKQSLAVCLFIYGACLILLLFAVQDFFS